MDSIVPNRELISERFPIASFCVRVPRTCYFEIVCTSDPRLFHTDHASARTPANFYSSRSRGLLQAESGSNTYLLPAAQLQRFAGTRRLYYALATYGGRNGEGARFSIGPDALDRVPSIGIAADFTGRSLDRTRVGMRPQATAAYGGTDARVLRWGGDAVLEAERAAHRRRRGRRGTIGSARGGDRYDDGFDPGLWSRLGSGLAGGDEDALYADDDLVGRETADATEAEMEDGAMAYGFVPRRRPLRGPPRFGRRPQARFGDAADPPKNGNAVEPPMEAPMEAPIAEYEDGASYHSMHPQAGMPAPAPVSGTIDVATPPAGDPTDADVGPEEYEDGAQLRAMEPEAAAPIDQPAIAGRARSRPVFAGGQRHGRIVPPPNRPPAQTLAYGNPEVAGVARARAQAGRASRRGRHPAYREDSVEESLPVGPAARPLGDEVAAPQSVDLAIADKVAIVRTVGRAESGDEGYSAIYADGEFNDPQHPFYQRVHVGLSWGLLLFTQRGGALGRVLALAKEREEAILAADPPPPPDVFPSEHHFAQLFGEHSAALLETTDPANASAPEDMLQPVDGAPLWAPPWPERFEDAGEVEYIRAAQNQVAVEDYVDPILPIARGLGIDTARGLALLVDRVVHMGLGAGMSWIMRTLGPIRTEADREAALAAVGFAGELGEFRRSRGLSETAASAWDPTTHAALAEALRELGPRSPVAVPDRDALLRSLAEAARGTAFEARVMALYDNQTDFDDSVSYRLS